MRMILLVIFLFVIAIQKIECIFNATSNKNIIYYWGQNSASVALNGSPEQLWQKRLSYYCDNSDKDIIVVSFLHQFGRGRSTAFDLANRSRDCKGFIPGTQLLDCPFMEEDIRYCQSQGIKIILSMGGATPAYGLTTEKEGVELANELWDTFGAGHLRNRAAVRPFGNVTLDGFDLDIENGEIAGYTAFVHQMRKNFKLDTSKSYYIAAAPQCPFPDYYVGEALNHAWFDFIMIQFYNNYCNIIDKTMFNYQIWDTWANTVSLNKNVKLFVGIPGSPTAAGRGYVPYSQLVQLIQPLQSLKSFGGMMVWDASQAYGNTEDILPNYAYGITRLIKQDYNNTLPILFASHTINITSSTLKTTIPETSVFTTTELISKSKPSTITKYQTTLPTSISVTKSGCEFNKNHLTNITISQESHNSSTTSHHCQSAKKAIHFDQPCLTEGMFTCSSQTGFAQCSYGHWIIRNCPQGTICKQNNDTIPLSIYCGFP